MSIPSLAYEKGKVTGVVSPYQPSTEIKELTSLARFDIQTGDEILNRPFNEFNNMSLIQRMNTDQKDWMAWSESPSENPDESWMFTGTSSVTRNKIISTAAHLTAQVIFPNIFAQNEDDEEDEGAAYVIRTAIEYNARKSNYEQTFLFAVIAGLVNPVNYYQVEYCQSYIDILEGTEDSYKKVKVLDEMMSGFQDSLLPADEILIANPYQFDIQKQAFVIHRKRISYHEAEAKYGDHQNFVHVKPGVISLMDSETGLFYNIDDVTQDSLVEETVLKYRHKDKEICFINGVYMSNANTEYNPIGHRDNKNRPKYNIVKFGAEPIDAMRFWAYKSLAAKLANDKELVDRMRQNAVDASTFAAFPSIFTMGAGKLDRSVFIPATTTEIGKDAKVSPATGFANPSYAYNAAKEAEQQLNETSLDPQLSGVGGGQKTRGEAVLLQQNAINNLGIIGKMIGTMVKEVGQLKVDDILRYQTIGETQELGGGALGTKYMTMILNDKVKDGKKTSVHIRFTDKYAGRKMSKEQKRKEEIKLYEEAGDDKEIVEANPALLRKMDYLIVVEPDALNPKNNAFERVARLETYDRAILNPLIAQDPEKMADVTRDFLFEPTVKSEAAKYIPKDTKRAMQNIIQEPKKGMVGRTFEGMAMRENNLAP